MGSRDTAELILNFTTRLSGELHAPSALPRQRSLVFVEQKTDKPQIQSGRFGGREKYLASTGIRTPDRAVYLGS